jgi:hypothetical protein
VLESIGVDVVSDFACAIGLCHKHSPLRLHISWKFWKRLGINIGRAKRVWRFERNGVFRVFDFTAGLFEFFQNGFEVVGINIGECDVALGNCGGTE